MPVILSTAAIARDVWRIWLDAPTIARKRQPGQFVILRIDETGERIPLTIADVDRRRGAIALIVQVVGKTTRQLCALPAGATVSDLAGPLGQPTRVEPGQHVCCVGGGIGAAVTYPIACAVRAGGGRVTTILGARSKDLVILESELRAISDQLVVTTDDGTYGMKGPVTAALLDLLARGAHFDSVLAVGPIKMMEAVCDLTRPHGLRTMVSLNPVMVDGTGMCGGCRVSIAGRPRFVCVDGPEFDGHEVDFTELAARLAAYRQQEREAAERAARLAAAGQLAG